MARIGFLGMGAMGARMAARLVEAGHEVAVWNRTRARAAAVRGATVADSPRDAARGAEVVFSMVRDDAASAEVWLGGDGALGGLGPRAVGVECSTVSPEHAARLAEAFAAAGRGLVDAPLAGSRPQAEAGQLIFLAGGEVARVEPFLLQMGAAVHRMGPVGSGAVMKLVVNGLFGVQLAAVAELMAFARDRGLAPERVVEVLSATPVMSPIAAASAQGMLKRAFDPMFPIALVAKDFGYVQAGGVTQAAGRACAEARDAGLGDRNITAIWAHAGGLEPVEAD
ncbi:NAD(P)-dependent oxidoreductase [Pontivivens ytuae]|uniref:NAD(P)-dependent oxidoreductase n=1 Tax=Pontivivens ytuae TaxID=2789856 RepID=A0A7S9LUD6_9RHOB|nr:NAD(P)-dependent oxidoreductase [Pontivivens ytuae]QPH55486.1 NAD(P)-dependent oxidoreductase [Pontivivens ytuae]